MACPVNRESIKEALTKKVQELLKTQTPTEINNLFGVDVFFDEDEIQIPETLIDRYEDTYEDQQGTLEGNQAYLQIRDAIMPKSSPLSLRKVNIMLERMGITVKSLTDLIINGNKLNINGVALPLQSLVAVADGKLQQALPEEAFHIGLEILEQKNKGLVNQMLSQVTFLPIWNQVYEQYKDIYDNNLRKIKKEAIAKQLVITQNQEEQSQLKSWWRKALDFLKGLFASTEVELNPFSDALNILTNNDIGTVRNTLLNNIDYLKEQNIPDETAQNIVQLANSDISNQALQEAIQQIVPEQGFYQLSNSDTFSKLTAPKDNTNTTDIKDGVERTFKEVYGNSNTFADAWNEFNNQETSDGYNDVMDVLRRYIDSNGNARENPLTDTNPSSDSYDEIEDIVASKIAAFPSGTKFSVNQTLIDQNSKRQGNVDLLAVTPSGQVSTFKFIASEEKSITSQKRTAFSRYMGDIKTILRNGYGMRTLGDNRIIPLAMGADERTDFENSTYLEIAPVTDQTNVKAVNDLLTNLNRVLDRTRESSNKREQTKLNVTSNKVVEAINTLLVTGSFNKIVSLGQDAGKDAEELLNSFDNRKNDKNYFKNLSNAQDNLIALNEMNTIIRRASKSSDELFQGKKQKIKKADQVTQDNKALLAELNDKMDIINNENAEKQGVKGILNAEVVVSWGTRMFKRLSESQTKATQYLYRRVSEIDRGIETTLTSRLGNLKNLRGEAIQWAKQNGIKESDLIKQIQQKDNFQLINQYDKETFITDLIKAQEAGNNKAIDDIVDKKAYDTFVEGERQNRYFAIDNDIESDQQEKQNQKDLFEENYNLYNPNNYQVKKFISDKYYTEEYKNLLKRGNEPIYKMWKYNRDLNDRAEAAGALQEWQAKNVIPQIRKDLLDKLVFGGKIQLGGEMFRNLAGGSVEDFKQGSIDPITGEIINKIPFYYTRDLGAIQADGTKNYDNVSTDFFKVMGVYEHQVTKYEAYAEIEDEISLMLKGERMKESLATNRFGNVIEGKTNNQKNDINAKYFENFIRAKIYGQRNIDNQFDKKLIQLSLTGAKKLNKLAGRDIVNTEYDKHYITVTGLVDGMNKFFQMKVLGLNPVISLSNFVGGNMQGIIENGKYFRKREFLAAEMEYAGGKWNAKTMAYLDYFDYLYDGERTRELVNQLSLNKLTRSTIQEYLYSFQKISEKPLQGTFAIALGRNTIVEDGKLINIREYLKGQEKYKNIYNLPTKVERDNLQREFEQEVIELKKRSIFEISTFENEKLVIPGIERGSEEVSRYIEFTHQLVRQSTGGGNKDDLRQANLTMLGRSALMFKSWIFPLLSNRISPLTYNIGRDTYTLGRWNSFVENLSLNLVKSGQDLYGIISGNDRGIQIMKERYQDKKEKYLNKTGQDDFESQFTERDFIDMYRQGIKSTMQEALMLISIMGIIAFVGAHQPPKDKEVALGSWKWIMRSLNKIEDELGFFYDPRQLANAANGGLLPAAGVMTDLIKLGDNLRREIGAQIYDDEQAAKRAHPLKYAMKAFPVAKQMDQFLVIFNSELAKELDVDIDYKDQVR